MIALPAVERPKQVEHAANVLEARERDLVDAGQGLREARAGVEEAKRVDLDARARARDEQQDDPGRVHEQRARAALEDAESNVAVERLRVTRAEDALRSALDQHMGDWRAAVEAALAKADDASLRALARLEATEQARRELRGVRAWLARPSSAPKIGGPIASPIKRNINGDLFTLDELVVGVRAAIEQSTLERDRERAADREAVELEAERVRRQRAQMRERAIPAHD